MNNKHMVVIAAVVALVSFVAGSYYHKMKNDAPSDAVASTIQTQQQALPSAAALDTSTSNTLIRSHSPILGSVNASVTIVEFLDPSCEACRAFFPTVEGILERYPNDVRVVIRYAPFHQGSAEAIGILEASRKQNLFGPVLAALFERQQDWAIHGAPDLEKAWELAAQAGLDVEKGKVDAADPSVTMIINQDVADIEQNNVRGTPTFFINGVLLTDFGQQQLIDAVDKQVSMSKNSMAE